MSPPNLKTGLKTNFQSKTISAYSGIAYIRHNFSVRVKISPGLKMKMLFEDIENQLRQSGLQGPKFPREEKYNERNPTLFVFHFSS